MVGLNPQGSQDHIGFRIALLVTDHQVLAGILNPKAQELIFGNIGHIGYVLINLDSGSADFN
jgi:hypothetical protein